MQAIKAFGTPALEGRRWLVCVLLLGLLLAGFYILFRLLIDLGAGGHEWKQGDWLINNENGPVRRGALGSAFIYFGDLLGIGLIPLVVTVQFALFSTLLLVTLVLAYTLSHNAIYWVMFYSPAFIILFWAANPEASMRKELIAFAAFAMVPLSAIVVRHFRAVLIVSSALFSFSIIASETNVFLVPAYVIALAMVLTHRGFTARIIAPAILWFVLLSTGAIIYAAAHSSVSNFWPVCEPLLQRGIDRSFCNGAIEWLQFTSSENIEANFRIHSGTDLWMFPLVYAAVSLPIAYVIYLHTLQRFMAALFIATALPYIPLYVVAVDWGRWMNFHIFSFCMIFISLLLINRIKLERQGSAALAIAFVLSSLFWSPHHISGITDGGVVRQFVLGASFLASNARDWL